MDELSVEAEVESFVDGVSSKVEELLNLDLFCRCGNAITIFAIKKQKCPDCWADITVHSEKG